jgi:hypothetical protein
MQFNIYRGLAWAPIDIAFILLILILTCDHISSDAN